MLILFDVLPFFLGFVTVVIIFLCVSLFCHLLYRWKDKTSSNSPFAGDLWSQIIRIQKVEFHEAIAFNRPLPLLKAMNYINLEEIEHD